MFLTELISVFLAFKKGRETSNNNKYTAFNARLTWCIQSVLTQDINEYIVLLGVACGYQGKEKGEKRPQLAKPAILVPLVIGLVFAIGNLNLPALTCIFHLCQFLRALRPSQKFFYSVSSDIY